MDPKEVLEIGSKYSKKDLSVRLDEPTLKRIRIGQYRCKRSEVLLLFPNLENEENHRNYFEEDLFHWDSMATQGINSRNIQDAAEGNLTTHLFTRVCRLKDNETQPFVFCGRLKYLSHQKKTVRPVHIIFKNIDYEGATKIDALREIYEWEPPEISN